MQNWKFTRRPKMQKPPCGGFCNKQQPNLLAQQLFYCSCNQLSISFSGQSLIG